MKQFITTTFARAGGWLVGVRRVRTAMTVLLLTMFIMPQKAAAADSRQDYEDWYAGWGFEILNNTCIQFKVSYWDDYGTDEGWCSGDGLVLYASKNGGSHYDKIGSIKTSSSGGLTLSGLSQEGGTWWESTYEKSVKVRWNLSRQWLNCNIKLKLEGDWCDSDGANKNKKTKTWECTSWYTHTVRDISWNGEYSIAADGTLTVPYKFGGGCNTDGETHICTRINGTYNSTIGPRSPANNYAAGSYNFNLNQIGMNMRSQFNIEPYHEFTHNNDKDASNGTKYYQKNAGVHTFIPMPLASITSAVFNQESRNVVLKWTADNTNYGNGTWVIYRNGEKIGAVSQGTYTYTDQNADNNTADRFPYESDVKYYIYYIAKGWAETAQRSELKSNEVSVNTARKVPLSNPNAECQADRIVFTWASDGYPQGWGNQFKIYVDNETTPIYTITPTAGQTSFRWEHRATDQHSDRQSGMDGTVHYTEEPLNACSPHTYRIEGVIGNKVFSSKTYEDRAIGTGTLFYTFEATKGAYPGTVKLNWHVNLQGSTSAKTYIVDRRRTDKEDEEWTNLYRTSTTDEYLFYTDDTPLPGVFYDYRVTVQDKCDDGTIIPNDITDIGFAQTTGTMSGRITFGATGSSVANVDVEARRTGESVEDNAQYHAMRFTGNEGAVIWKYPSETYAADKFATGNFSVQMWIYPETLGEAKIIRLNGETCYVGMDANGKLTLVDGSKTCTFDNTVLTAGQYNHVVLTRNGQTVTASVVGTDADGMAVLNSSTQNVDGSWKLTGATQLTVGHFIGYVDDFRLWTKTLTEAEILENYDHLLVGNEKQLETYWTFDEGLSKQFFDYSRDGTVYHQHHGKTGSNAEPSNLTPAQLKLKAKTDSDGNFIIQGVPFSGEGTTYAVIPTLGIHQFNPTQQLRFVGNNSLVHNGTDFTDISSFPVRGKIRYANTDYPVEGVNFYVDGQICAKEGQPIATNAYGEYEISVPIGEHYITVQKQGHEFANGGRYPADPNKAGTLVNYNDAVSNLDFEDITLVTVAGRVTGGKIEEQKPLGFGESVNNIGQATITLGIDTYRLNVKRNIQGTTISYDSNTEDLAVSSPTTDVQSVTVRQGGDNDEVKKVIIKTDPQTGEFAALLPPIAYRVEKIEIASNPDIAFENLPVIYAEDPTETSTDTLETDDGTIKKFEYVAKLIQRYYTDPVLEVTQKDRQDGSFGEKEYAYSDKLTPETKVPLYTVNDNSPIEYTFGYPLFKQQNTYIFNVRGYEIYQNFDSDAQNPVTFEVPLRDVPVTFSNQMGTGQQVVINPELTDDAEDKRGDLGDTAPDEVTLDEDGTAQYEWTAGMPNITTPYTLALTATYVQNDRTYTWTGVPNALQPDAKNCLLGVVTGALPTGTNFVTSGPDQVTMILRDPGGTGSQAYWETGNTVTSTVTTEQSIGNETETMTHTEIGFELTQFNGVGIGAISGIITNTKEVTTVDLGVTTAVTGVDSNTKSVSITTNKRVATSDQPEYVGAQGDVFIGNATNILFGNARSVGLQKDGEDFTLTAMDNYVTGTEFGTTFNYTQNYIENVMIPNFIALRNKYLSKGYDDEGLIYHSTVDEDDINYGANDYYTCTKPDNATKLLYTDSVAYYNEQIANWEKLLAYNEEMKVKAIDNPRTYFVENHSFDSGTFIESSTTTTTAVTESYTTSFEAHLVFGSGTDFEIFGNDMNVNIQSTTSFGNSETDEYGNERTVTTGYALIEAGDDDALTVDVLRAPDGMGAIFVTRGGQTSCPYEGAQMTKYFEPGEHTIATATMQIEMPKIAVENAANNAVGVPAGKKASYILLLTNESETGEDCFFDLHCVDGTNTEGAKLTINGEPFGNGRTVLVPAGETVRMNLELAQNNTGGLIYKDIDIMLASQCQYDPASTWEVIGDVVTISAEFVPSSTDVTLRIDNTVVNTSTKGMLPLTVKDYDPNYDGLKYIAVQYQGVGETAWHDARKYVMSEQDIVNPQIEEVLPTGGINLNFDMTNGAVFPDRTYKFRAISARTYGNGEVTNVSQEIQVVKDMSRPKPLGQPQPTDGILDAGDELSILFNENIQSGELTKDANFLVTGVLNGSELAHSTALELENTDQAAATEANITLANKSFATDMWIKADGEGVILSHGTGAQKMNIGLNADEMLEVTFGGETYTSMNKVPQHKWSFLTLSYEKTATGGKLSAQMADETNTTVLFDHLDVVAYDGAGPLAVGQQMKGAIHELLLWDEAHDIATALQQRNVTKSPATRHLIGYWKMDEGEGTQITDYARNRHMTMAAETWHIENENKAVNLDGTKHLGIFTREIPPMPEDDYAVELWVKAGQQTGESQLLQGGEVSLWLNGEGLLQLTSGETTVQAGDKSILDNVWHHVALNVLRQGNTAVYVDGEPRATIASTSIGTIASDMMIIGARRTIQDVTTESEQYKYDRYLTATVDEVRIWNATKSAEQLRKARKLRLTGQEPGLVAYYPFEVKTLDAFNQVVTNGSDADLTGSNHVAELSNAVILETEYVDDAPALRLKPEETNVSFSFTSSNNKIVIDIDETPAKIEGCTLNFTVRNVHDQNGNLSEPVTWSAYINQNSLVWKEKELSVTTSSNAPANIVATIVNKGGLLQNWILSGMPSWLKASMEYGQLSALSEQSITFTVSEATPIGKYEETVFLTGNDNIETPLTLYISVTGEAPDWAVNANDFENSMNLIGSLSILNVPSEDADDMVGAFIDGECRGVAHPEYDKRYDTYFVTLDIYANGADEGKEVVLKAYDASTGVTYPVVETAEDMSFKTNAMKGSFKSPVALNAVDMLEQERLLSNGWSWISLFVEAEDMSLPAVFSSTGSSVTQVKGVRSYMSYEEGGWKGRAMELNNSSMYKVRASEAVKLRVTGTRVDPQQVPITLNKGWNWVAYNGTQNMSVSDGLADLEAQDGDYIKAQRGFAQYDGYEWKGTLRNLTPGEGYMINSASSATRTFRYPTATAAPAREHRQAVAESRLTVFSPVDYHQYAENMTAVIQVRIDGVPAAGVEVGVFAGSECRTAEVTDASGIAYLTIPGSGHAQLTLQVGDGSTLYSASETLEYVSDAIVGSVRTPLVIDFTATGIGTIASDSASGPLYDLQGRRVQPEHGTVNVPSLRKGVYIQERRKKVIK